MSLPAASSIALRKPAEHVWRISWYAVALSIALNSSVIACLAMLTDPFPDSPEVTYPVTIVIPVVPAAEPEEGLPSPESAQAGAEPEEQIESPDAVAAEAKPAVAALASADPARGSLSNYWDLVRAQIARGARYPHSAASRHVEGLVQLRLTLRADGTLADCRALGESHPALELAALNAVRRAAPFPAPVDDSPEARSAVLPVRFALEANQQEESKP